MTVTLRNWLHGRIILIQRDDREQTGRSEMLSLADQCLLVAAVLL